MPASEAGKGDTYRPYNRESFEAGWERAFKKTTTLEDLTSPCVEVCQLDYVNKVCAGCFRTLDEIAAWMNCNDDEKRRILANVEKRKKHAFG